MLQAISPNKSNVLIESLVKTEPQYIMRPLQEQNLELVLAGLQKTRTLLYMHCYFLFLDSFLFLWSLQMQKTERRLGELLLKLLCTCSTMPIWIPVLLGNQNTLYQVFLDNYAKGSFSSWVGGKKRHPGVQIGDQLSIWKRAMICSELI